MDEFSGRQLCALCLCAFSAVALQYCAVVSWPWVLLGAAVAAVCYLYLGWAGRRVPGHVGLCGMTLRAFGAAGGRVLLVLLWLWTVLATAVTAQGAFTAFPEAKSFSLIPVVLLLLAAWAASKSTAVVCRVGGIHAFLILGLIGGVLAFAASDIKAANLRPAGTWREAAVPLAVFLMPAGGLLLREKVNPRGGRYGWWFLAGTALAAGCSAVTVGCLGLPLAQASQSAFYEMSKSVSVFGVMERFESLASSAALIARTCLLAFLLVQCGMLSRCLLPNLPAWGGSWASAAAAYGAAFLLPAVPKAFICGGAILFWGIFPALVLGIVAGKKIVKKQEKDVDKSDLV